MILLKFVQPVAPSSEAASLRSAGIACRAPVQTRNMYGNPSQRLASRTATFAQNGLPSQLMSRFSMLFIKPNSELKKLDQISRAMNPGMAYGSSRIERYAR